ncbi:protein trichome birefringence-like 19 [Triticum dicoccoides]|uniref:protein trichome birefringence-like 19 n=1 Tax=Triticum dicoccoides TaxID=85692 RepID=UPI0018918521|nr:protein trichome birefringence-like 19 [Triticum dicoccoides]
MKPNNHVVRRAASTSGLVLILLLVAFTASNYSSLYTEQLLVGVPVILASSTAAAGSRASDSNAGVACDVAKGEWVPDPAAPYYTNATCPLIDARQDCMKYGKPGIESILRWRWQPHGCDLPRFDAAAFLRLVRGKSMAFVGDSVARNHMQSLMCLLAEVEHPREIEPKDCVHCTRKYHYREHDFTVCVFWTPFLVRWNLTRAGGQQFMDPHNVYLDEPDPEWSRDVAGYDYVVLNGAKWFTRPTVLYEGGRLLGCANLDGCEAKYNATAVAPHYAVRASFRTALRALAGFRGRVVVRTVAPPHYENGKWYDGGNCLRTGPMRSNETSLPETEAAFHVAQVEEFWTASAAGRFVLMDESSPPETEVAFHAAQVEEFRAASAAGRFVLMDVSEMMQMRGDGHPGQYGHWPHEKVGFGIDCVHWCLPGPVDAWSEVLLHLLT